MENKWRKKEKVLSDGSTVYSITNGRTVYECESENVADNVWNALLEVEAIEGVLEVYII